jgi:ABC-2 type transport system ATP-binding protein
MKDETKKEIVIKVSNLKKKYGNFVAVNNIDLKVEEGDFFGFIGPNGAGKSTTINCILNYIFPNEGDIKVLGMDSREDSEEIKKQIGFVPAEVFYYDNMKVKDILNYSNTFYENIDKDLMKKYVKLFDIPMNKKVGELSSGNKKKVAIVQSLLHNPKILILDEPSNGLDPLMQANFFNILEEIRKNGTTIFMSSHILSDVQKYCNKVAFIKEGKIIKDGAINEILDKDLKIIKITTDNIVELKKNLKVKDIQNVIIDGNTISFIYKNTPNELLKLLVNYEIKDISIHTPDLDDLFMTFYKEEK